MNQIVGKLKKIEFEVSAKKGDFSLFALFLREDSPGKWDIVVSAPWIEKDKKAGLEFIAKRVQEKLTSEELSNISRIVIVDKGNPAINAMHQAANVTHGSVEIRNSNFFGLQINHAYVITSADLEKKAA